ncbi:MAG: 3-hydroxyacyl-CoA dehydrogenase NAD-binding domain-containing protein, partial [Pseudomonadales bacterium]
MSVVNYELHANIGVISINNPPVNALSHSLRSGITNAIKAAQSDDSAALVLICEGRTFIAGADITEFGKPPQAPTLPDMLESIENSKKPVLAAIHGTALGGGFETALACHYRCALVSAKVGLPEVKLGLLPGAGGTQRTPRLAGVVAALDMITSGNPMGANKALELGLLDTIVDGDDLQQAAIEYAQALIAAPLNRVRDLKVDPTSYPSELFDQYRAKLAKKARGQSAPQRIVDCIEAAATLPFDAGLVKERELFVECLHSEQSAAMRHLFFAERQAAKVDGLAKDTPVRAINSVGIIGGGTMGGGIAMNFANAGIPVTLLEINNEALARGQEIIAKNYAATVSKGKLTVDNAEQKKSLISGSTDYADLAQVDLVIEAVFENLQIKQEVFVKLDTVCKPGAILATNTSYQDVDAIAAVTQRPEDVIGLHFFSPANVMKLLEVVRGEKTGGDVIATAMAVAKTIQKVPVLAKVCYGFIGNRMLRHYFREAQLCLIEGAIPEQIDGAMESWGMAMGPLAVSDLAGLDIGYKAREGLTLAQKGDPKTYRVADVLVENGRLGQKSGAGFYQYDPQTRARISDPEVLTVVRTEAEALGVSQRKFSEEEIVDRLSLALINEGAKILEEGIAQRASDIDIVYVFGYGFPMVRGGPMFYADEAGLK